MQKANIGKRAIIVFASIALAALAMMTAASIRAGRSRLTKDQVAGLRDKYPVCAKKIPALVSMRKPTLENVKEYSETFVYGKIEGEMETYYRAISTGNGQIDRKWAEHGMRGETKFFRYKVKVISDSENMLEAGEVIRVCANYIFVDYYPRFSGGMEVVMPVSAAADGGDYSHSAVGTYYVTGDGFAISAFDEADAQGEGGREYSGLKVGELLKNFKKA